ncbi:MAG: GNAT family protein [Rhodospirillales bacterium]
MTDKPAEHNDLGQPLDFRVPDWTARERPPGTPIAGRWCDIEPIDADAHAQELYDAVMHDADGANWTYLPYGPFATFAAYDEWLRATCLGGDPMFHTIRDRQTGKAVGIASLMRIDPANGVIEVGHIHYSPLLQRTPAGTEAMYLLMRRVFDELGYRRYEWKCNNMNAASKRAAERLGFVFEGVFRQHIVTKGRNRDTAWFAIIDRDWPAVRAAFEAWLDPENFDEDGRQRTKLDARYKGETIAK